MATLNELRTEVRDLLGADADTRFFSDALLNRWLSRGAEQVSAITHCLQTTTAVTLNGSASYAVADDLLQIEAVFFQQRALRKAVHRQMGSDISDPTGPPIMWGLFARRLWPYPRGTDGQLEVLYTRRSADATAIPDPFQHLVALWSAIRGKQRQNRWSEAAQLYAEWNQLLLFYRQDLVEQVPESLDQLRVADITLSQ